MALLTAALETRKDPFLTAAESCCTRAARSLESRFRAEAGPEIAALSFEPGTPDA
jgi:hypothetical protein